MKKNHQSKAKILWPYNLAKLAGGAAIIVGSIALISWLFYFWIPPEYQILLSPIKPNTALCFILCGTALWLQSEKNLEFSRLHYLAQISSATVFLIAILTLFEYFFGINLGIDQSIFKEPLNSLAGTIHMAAGRMSPFSATNFALLGFSLFFLDSKSISYQMHQFFMCIVTFVSSLQLLLQLYGSNMGGVLGFSTIHTGIALPVISTFILLGLGVLMVRPEKGVTSIFISRNLGGTLARRLTPPCYLHSDNRWLFGFSWKMDRDL